MALPDARAFGRFILAKRLAAGGMGEIYLAALKGPGDFEKLLVIKRVLEALTSKPGFVEMFLSEARVAATARRAGETSTTVTRPAPPAFATCNANRPIAPAPKITTVSGKRRRSMAHAWTALPSGSISDACTGVTSFGMGKSVDAGTATCSANAPGRLVPNTSAVGQT